MSRFMLFVSLIGLRKPLANGLCLLKETFALALQNRSFVPEKRSLDFVVPGPMLEEKNQEKLDGFGLLLLISKIDWVNFRFEMND